VQQHDSIGDNNRRDFHPQVIDDRSCRDMLQQEHLKSQQAIDGFAVELSQTTVCEIFALAKTDRPAGRFNRRQQSPRFSPAGDRQPQLSRYAPTGASEKPAGDRRQQPSSYAATARFNRRQQANSNSREFKDNSP